MTAQVARVLALWVNEHIHARPEVTPAGDVHAYARKLEPPSGLSIRGVLAMDLTVLDELVEEYMLQEELTVKVGLVYRLTADLQQCRNPCRAAELICTGQQLIAGQTSLRVSPRKA